MKDYRKYYIEETGKNIPKDFEIHHIDANRKNNKIENLISLPQNFHKTLHAHIGLLPKEILQNLLDLYSKTNKNFTNRALANWIFNRLKKIGVSKEILRKNQIQIYNQKIRKLATYWNNGFN